jgi:hypothetical protein
LCTDICLFISLFILEEACDTEWGGFCHLCCDTDWDSSSNCCVIVLRSFPVAGISGKNAPMFSSSQEHDASIEWNAISRPSQEIPEHSKLLTPNPFHVFLSTPPKCMTMARKHLSLRQCNFLCWTK